MINSIIQSFSILTAQQSKSNQIQPPQLNQPNLQSNQQQQQQTPQQTQSNAVENEINQKKNNQMQEVPFFCHF